jgi:hypothetical protein
LAQICAPHTCDLGGIDCLSRWIFQSSKTKLAGLHQSLEPIDERSELAAKKAGRKYKKQFIITLSHQKLVLFFKHTIYQVVHKKAKIINKIITK